MNLKTCICLLFFAFGFVLNLKAQADSTSHPVMVDVVWLRGGSRLTGTILKWELARGMELKLATGAVMIIPRNEIDKVYQDVMLNSTYLSNFPVVHESHPYAFNEHGLYQSFSLFLNFSDPGGAGLQYTIGHRFNRMLGVGGGIGIETNDFFNERSQVPLFVEARGFFLPEKITPYYAVKLGYGFAIKHNTIEVLDSKGGLYFSPEIGVRFGSRKVNYYLGMEYKILQAKYVNAYGWEGTTTDKITYRRLEMRTGLIF